MMPQINFKHFAFQEHQTDPNRPNRSNLTSSCSYDRTPLKKKHLVNNALYMLDRFGSFWPKTPSFASFPSLFSASQPQNFSRLATRCSSSCSRASRTSKASMRRSITSSWNGYKDAQSGYNGGFHRKWNRIDTMDALRVWYLMGKKIVFHANGGLDSPWFILICWISQTHFTQTLPSFKLVISNMRIWMNHFWQHSLLFFTTARAHRHRSRHAPQADWNDWTNSLSKMYTGEGMSLTFSALLVTEIKVKKFIEQEQKFIIVYRPSTTWHIKSSREIVSELSVLISSQMALKPLMSMMPQLLGGAAFMLPGTRYYKNL